MSANEPIEYRGYTISVTREMIGWSAEIRDAHGPVDMGVSDLDIDAVIEIAYRRVDEIIRGSQQ